MKLAVFVLALVASSAVSAARADQAGPFAKWVDKGSARCVPVSDLASVAKPIRLTPEQFEFVRALFVALPPMSRSLPPGDHAVMAQAGGQTLLALAGDNVSCARFLAPDFVVAMVMEVGQGAAAEVGEPATFTTIR